jgi:signal transduction histidine kinase
MNDLSGTGLMTGNPPSADDLAILQDVALLARIDVISSLLDVVCLNTGMGFAAIARVTDSRWVACRVKDEISFGLEPGGELKLESTICHEIRQSGMPVAIDSVATDPLYRTHHTPLQYGFQSYISVPIYRKSGEMFGTLCAIDPNVHVVNTPAMLGMFKMFAELIGHHLDAQDSLDASREELRGVQQTAELREQFIAVLGHDLRNPLSAISASAALIQRYTHDDRVRGPAIRIDRSVQRMAGLIDNVLDFARGRLGGGFSLDQDVAASLADQFEQVVNELRAAWPERLIVSRIALAQAVTCDAQRLCQMLSNLVANALTHGHPDRPILIEICIDGRHFEMAVENQGEAIPPAMLDRLFEPFTRASVRVSQQGLGLGLFIVSEIARAHQGDIRVDSTEERTRFVFRMAV